MKRSGLHEKMFREMQDKNIFEQAKQYAFEYADQAWERHVYPTQEALDNLDRFDSDLPASTGDPGAIIDTLHQYGSPATVSQIAGRYFGFVNGGVIPAALAARWLADFWDQNAPLYVTSPIIAKLESVVEKWLRELFGLPDHTAAGFVSGTSMAIFCGLAAARWRLYQRLGWDVNAKGLTGAPKIRIIAGRSVHSADKKAIALLGFGLDNIEWVDVDDQGRVIPEKVPPLDDRTILILQAGEVHSGAFDDFSLCERARAANAWVHIDGAFGLWAAGTQRLSHLTRGIENANSWSVDGHKTLNTPYDSGIILCKDKEALVAALQATGAYIAYGEHRDGMLYTPEMSRRARIVELWAALQYLGKSGIDELVYGLHERAVQLREGLVKEGFHVPNDIVFNQVLVMCNTDQQTERTLKNLQDQRECWCGGSSWFDRVVIRVSVCSWATTEDDIDRTVRAFVRARETGN